MVRYKCLVADDNMLERDALEMHLGKIQQLQIVASCENGLEAQRLISNEDIDIVFSDIDMPQLSGLSLLKTLKKAPVFVFVTAHPEYAVESFNVDAIDFIVKPVTFERVLKAVNKAVEYMELKQSSSAKHVSIPIEKENYFFIRESNNLIKLNFEEVAYIESMGDFSKIYMLNDKKHVTLVSLKNLEAQLPQEHFTRVHKQYIINHHYISTISTDEIKLADKYMVPLSLSYKQELLNKIVNDKVINRHIAKD